MESERQFAERFSTFDRARVKQHEAVILAMEANGGYATLGQLYAEVPKIGRVEWKTKTPFASMRRIVQDARFFFRIRPGLWALNSHRSKLPAHILALLVAKGKERNTEYTHYYYQGLLVELGNMEHLTTYVPGQDKNRPYLSKKLADVVTAPNLIEFTHKTLLDRARTIDVIWFNEREMPDSFFEVEHSTDFQNSFIKFMELRDFSANMKIVADQMRIGEYKKKLAQSTFAPIRSRVQFWEYSRVEAVYNKRVELRVLEQTVGV